MAAPVLLAPTAPTLGGAGFMLLTLDYDVTGRARVALADAPLLGWVIDAVAPANPIPVVPGSLPPAPPSTAPILSPQWAIVYSRYAVYTANPWNGGLADFFTWVATNNGATRKLTADFAMTDLMSMWSDWARDHPDLVG